VACLLLEFFPQGETLMKKLIQYFKDCRSELRKVVWPSKENVASSTKVVVISTVLVAVFLGLVDFVLLKLVYLLF